MTHADPKSATSTSLGLLALLIWSTSFAFARSVQEQIGPLPGSACVYLLAGILGCLYAFLIQRRGRQFLQMPLSYLLVCGSLFIVYILTVQLGIGLSRNRQQAIEVVILNYLWPGLTMAFSVPLLHRPAKWFLAPGILLGVSGVALGLFNGADFSLHLLRENVRATPIPYLLGLTAGVSWALYSNLSRRLAGPGQGSGVPVFLLLCGMAFAGLHILSGRPMHWTNRAGIEVLCAALFPSLLAYTFWETGMRRGRIGLIVATSYFTPLLSTIVTCLYLNVSMGVGLWLACVLVVAGAILSNLAVSEPPPPDVPSPEQPARLTA